MRLRSHVRSAALYQEVTGALDDLANPEETSKRAGTQKERIVDKRQSLSSIGRDATSHWVVPQYNTVLQRLRSSDAFPPVPLSFFTTAIATDSFEPSPQL